jgi:hypothetical protein
MVLLPDVLGQCYAIVPFPASDMRFNNACISYRGNRAKYSIQFSIYFPKCMTEVPENLFEIDNIPFPTIYQDTNVVSRHVFHMNRHNKYGLNIALRNAETEGGFYQII